MLNHVKSIAEVYKEEKNVLLMKMCIFYGINHITDLPMCIFPWPEAFLCGGDDALGFRIMGENLGQKSCPDFIKDISHCNRSVVT